MRVLGLNGLGWTATSAVCAGSGTSSPTPERPVRTVSI